MEQRVLWKYINKRDRDIHFSWNRWSERDADEFWEFRIPPIPPPPPPTN